MYVCLVSWGATHVLVKKGLAQVTKASAASAADYIRDLNPEPSEYESNALPIEPMYVSFGGEGARLSHVFLWKRDVHASRISRIGFPLSYPTIFEFEYEF